jgi:hypothetical protein
MRATQVSVERIVEDRVEIILRRQAGVNWAARIGGP